MSRKDLHHHPAALLSLLALLTLAWSPSALVAQDFVNFESPQTKPITIARDGSRLFVCNTPDNRVAVYSLYRAQQPTLLTEIFTGLEPVSVRQRTSDELWVVNHLSDTISIVSISRSSVVATLRVKDEPTDVVFAAGKAFVSVSGNDEIHVFNATTRVLVKKIALFGDEPRNLVVGRFGLTVWAVTHRSGNETTVLSHHKAPPQPKPTNPKLPPAPAASLVIHSEDAKWKAQHDVDLPDYDVFQISALTLGVTRRYRKVGTINHGIARRPATNELWVANSDARNLVRFVTNLRGHAWDSRITRIRTGLSPTVTPFDLNPGINYAQLPNNAALSTAIAQPTDVVWHPKGTEMYVAGFGTDRIAVVAPNGRVTARIEIGTTPGTKTDPRRKRGPRGLAVHPNGKYLYVLNRIANSLTIVDTVARKQFWELPLPDPTPLAIRAGRGFLYDAKLSGNGTFSCGSCHVDGDLDGLGWDLGDPGGEMFHVANSKITLHPMKGALTTQTLKGLKGTNPFHWRGDKPKLQDFNGAFDSLMGKKQLTDPDMDAFAEFIESIVYPPNPKLLLDGSLNKTPAGRSAFDGAALFHGAQNTLRCVNCHTLPTGTNGAINPANIIKEPQAMKVPQLRNMYKRTAFRKATQGRKGGFGLVHDGHRQDVFDFLGLPVFGPLTTNTAKKEALTAFCESINGTQAPLVGFQATLDKTNLNSAGLDVVLMRNRARLGDIDLIAKGYVDGHFHGFVYDVGTASFIPDTGSLKPIGWADLRTKIGKGQATLTFTGVPPGSGKRLGIDRDRDGRPDGDEGVTLYGAGTKGCAGVPTLTSSSEPRIGNSWYSFVGANAPANAIGWLGISTRKTVLPINGVTVWIDVSAPGTLIFDMQADPFGVITVPLPIPNNPVFVGFTTHSQFLWVDRCGPKGFSASNGMTVTVTK